MKAQTVIRYRNLMLMPALLVAAATVAAAVELPSPLVQTGWLAEHQGELVILDVREEAGSFVGTPPRQGEKPNLEQISGHIPGAVQVPWKQVVAKSAEDGVTLKAMVPTPVAFEALMRQSGVGHDSPIVIAGLGRNAKDQAMAARLYFTLKVFGHDRVALLDGGTAQWVKEGRPLAYTQDAPTLGDFTLGDFTINEVRASLIAGTRAVEDAIAAGDVQLVDCRTEDRFLGLNAKQGFVDAGHKGHLAGAKSLPFILSGDNDGPARLFTPEQIRQVAEVKGVDLNAPTIAYCDTGVAASLVWFTLHELIGNQQVSLYDGSMHAWSHLDGAHPVVGLEQIGEVEEFLPAVDPEVLQAPDMRPAPSLQTLVDQRRDALRARQERRFEVITGRQLFRPAWIAEREAMFDGYRESMQQAHRHFRDTTRLYRDAYSDAVAPWARPQREWAEMRHFLMQMEQLDREESLERYRYAHLPW
jgi:thiosulfate/3-mercaptopyruvate sulfurtransferase